MKSNTPTGELFEFSSKDTLLGKESLNCGMIANVSPTSIIIYLNASRSLEASKTEYKLIKKFNEISFNRLNKYVTSLLLRPIRFIGNRYFYTLFYLS